MRKGLEYIGTGEILNRSPMAQALRSTIGKQDLMKFESFCMPKDTTINRTKQQTTDWENFTYIQQRWNTENILSAKEVRLKNTK